MRTVTDYRTQVVPVLDHNKKFHGRLSGAVAFMVI
jgi:hypothetical protein